MMLGFLLICLTTSTLATETPIIGTFIASSYVKWIESAGGRVVPLVLGSSQNFTELLESVNGILIAGGRSNIENSTYSRLVTQIFEYAKAANDDGDYFPIWATCLGFEFITLASTADKIRHLARCDAWDQHLPLNLLEDWKESRLFKKADNDILNILTTMNVTSNFHMYCLTMDNFTRFKMDEFYIPLSTNIDKNGLEYITSVEAKNYPFYGTHFHPEKASFEIGYTRPNIPHTREAILANGHFAQFFIEEAKRSKHRFNSREIEEKSLIYSYDSQIYTGQIGVDFLYQQVYVFPV
ncbi:gamma-glutamyl hydrolase isoform X2 [Eurytemora carolleeae]|uniref:gamma-glutamyl hydrolase isoform X2 n=1 Tax=Eurytemora carolleeae TaxID=1294199 RepID=UPI000C76DBB6|nr:gamma-glutamyl hydrolase isoform X2 [Eurytemora carolleeae]|eukprot:XP_023345868.1 gamma-glutamyl hydrolase-like isoform X2 [Eurytemora affinis]